MEYLIGAFAVFFVYNLLTSYLDMPGWGWQICQVLLSAGAWWVLGLRNPVGILGIAGMASLVKGTEALLLVTRDRVTVEFLRSQRR